MSNDILNLTNLGTRIHESAEEIPPPGSEENPWIGVKRVVNGQIQFYALSGSERRRSIRAQKRADEAEQRKGQARYNRQQRKQEFIAGTRRQQLRILQGELSVPAAMYDNLTGALEREQASFARAAQEPQRQEQAARRRNSRLDARARARIAVGKGRRADFARVGRMDG